MAEPIPAMPAIDQARTALDRLASDWTRIINRRTEEAKQQDRQIIELQSELRGLRSTVEQIRELVLPSADQAEDENLYGLVVDIRRLVYEHDPAVDADKEATTT